MFSEWQARAGLDSEIKHKNEVFVLMEAVL